MESAEAAAWISPRSGWHQPPVPLILNRDDVHVWRVPLSLPKRLLADLVCLLSREEEARVAPMVCEEASRRFVASHGATRRILSRYSDERPEELQFATGVRGKPYLVISAGAPPICFSLSHSGEVALCAVTEGRDVGVDIEQIRPVSTWRQIAARYFSARENQALCSLAGDQASETFFQVWTAKEAYSKALGEGISERWAQFDVSLQSGRRAELVKAPPEAQVAGPFTLCPLAPGSGYIAAIAAQGVGWRLSCWQWSWVESPLASPSAAPSHKPDRLANLRPGREDR